MTTTAYLNGQPVTVIAPENRHEAWVETANGRVLRVYKAGLFTGTTRPTSTRNLKVNNGYGTDGAR